MIINFLKTETFLMIVAGMNILLLILYFCNILKLKKINKNYKIFMKKIGNGNNIDEMLKNYINKVDEVSDKNEEIINYCKTIDNRISLCIKKVGMVRYSAFKDTGSDLSFALALLNDKNDGVILNGIYSREMSNIYAKQVIDGKCSNKLSEEERQALEIAINR
jgi:hypothetical protein